MEVPKYFQKMIKTKSWEIQRSSEGKLPLLAFPVSVKLSVLQSPARLGEKVKALEQVVSRSCVVSQYVSYEFLVKCSVTDSPAVFLVDCLVVLLEVFLQAVKHKDTSYFCLKYLTFVLTQNQAGSHARLTASFRLFAAQRFKACVKLPAIQAKLCQGRWSGSHCQKILIWWSELSALRNHWRK